jgi:hypothetical protein
MKWRIVAFILVVLAKSMSCVPLGAAELSCSNLYTGKEDVPVAKSWWGWQHKPTPYATCLGGFLRGEISKGDYEKVTAFLSTHHPFVSFFNLISPGGDVDEALKIGRLFRQYLISTSAPTTILSPDNVPALSDLCRGQDCICASACALIWMGGAYRWGSVGLHRPRIVDATYRGLTPAKASTTYNRVLREVGAYLEEMEVPRSIVEKMVATSSGDIIWVDSNDEGLDRPPSLAEWVDASCGQDVPYNWDEKPTGEILNQMFKHADCARSLYASNRARLAGP